MKAAAARWLRERFELTRGGAGNLRSMEGLRGFAVLLVFLVHYATLSAPWVSSASAIRPVAQALWEIGHTGVDLFFVLSGYVIYGALISRGPSARAFLRRRFQRIYPTFAIMLALYIVLSPVFPAESRLVQPWSANILYVAANAVMLPGLFQITPIISVAWSLSYELLFYLTVPLLISVLALRRWSPAQRVGLFGVLTLITLVVCGMFDGPVRLVMFLSGMALFEVVGSRLWSAPRSATAVAILGVGLAATFRFNEASGTSAVRALLLFVSFFVLCHTCFSRPTSPVARAFSWTPARWLGNMSYSYYLIHGLALKCGFLVLAVLIPSAVLRWWSWLGLAAMMFMWTLPVAALLYLGVERRFSLRPVPQSRPDRAWIETPQPAEALEGTP